MPRNTEDDLRINGLTVKQAVAIESALIEIMDELDTDQLYLSTVAFQSSGGYTNNYIHVQR